MITPKILKAKWSQRQKQPSSENFKKEGESLKELIVCKRIPMTEHR